MTTTDAFTQAAHAEAERIYPNHDTDTLESRGLDGFAMGAIWARTYLAAQEPTDAEVEAAATALLAFVHNQPVDRIREFYKVLDRVGHWSMQARVALAAARKA